MIHFQLSIAIDRRQKAFQTTGILAKDYLGLHIYIYIIEYHVYDCVKANIRQIQKLKFQEDLTPLNTRLRSI